MSSKNEYRAYCAGKSDIPIFSRPEWFDLFKQEWDVIIWKEEDQIRFFPFMIDKKVGFHFFRNMPMTPYMAVIGDVFKGQLIHADLSKLISLLPNADEYYIDFHPNCRFIESTTNSKLYVKHTNIIALNEANLINTYKPSLQRQIRKAEKNLTMKESDDVNLFYDLYGLSLNQREVKNVVEQEMMKKIWNYISEKRCGRITLAMDIDGNIHAGLFCVWDAHVMYYLAGGTDKRFYGSGAMGMLLHEAITYAQNKHLHFFDFEGSMEASIDKFFKTFQTIEQTYYSFQKINSPILRIARKIKNR